MKKFLPVFLFLALTLPLLVNAAVEPQAIICNILQKIKMIVMSIGFGVAVIMLIWGGIMYMASGGDPEKGNKAKQLIINAIIGIAIVFAATFLLALVEGLLVGAGVQIFGSPCPSF